MAPTVLLVEDDEDDVFFMQRAFKQAGIVNPLHVVKDGRQAIEYLSGEGTFSDRNRWPIPCLMLLDLKLPHVMGLDVLKWLRSRPELETVVVVVLTSSREDRDIENAYTIGANSYLVKPPDAVKLQEMVKRIKEYWIELNQNSPQCISFATPKS